MALPLGCPPSVPPPTRVQDHSDASGSASATTVYHTTSRTLQHVPGPGNPAGSYQLTSTGLHSLSERSTEHRSTEHRPGRLSILLASDAIRRPPVNLRFAIVHHSATQKPAWLPPFNCPYSPRAFKCRIPSTTSTLAASGHQYRRTATQLSPRRLAVIHCISGVWTDRPVGDGPGSITRQHLHDPRVMIRDLSSRCSTVYVLHSTFYTLRATFYTISRTPRLQPYLAAHLHLTTAHTSPKA